MIRLSHTLKPILATVLTIGGMQLAFAQRPQTPIMGWASWNTYRAEISEKIIQKQTDALVSLGLPDLGYTYVNIDDGFFGGRDEEGNLFSHPTKFPSGMKAIADYIHQKGLKAGIYTDAGINSCASYWDSDPYGIGIGLYGNERRDLTLMLQTWGYDFIKVDWCGGDWMGLDEQVRYTEIGTLVRELNPDAVFNVCRWQFPGKWVTGVADSWRVSHDIANSFKSVLHIMDQNAELWKYSGPGHVNDMDILQVGRGLTYEEDKTHFTMWCMLNSPLIAGNDLMNISEQTLAILSNKDLIAINQDPMVYQARRVKDWGDLELWARPLKSTLSGEVAVALLNRSDSTATITFKPEDISIDLQAGYEYQDLWSKEFSGQLNSSEITLEVPSHGVIALKFKGKNLPSNVFQVDKDHKLLNNPRF